MTKLLFILLYMILIICNIHARQTVDNIEVSNVNVSGVRRGAMDEELLRIDIFVSGGGAPLTLEDITITSTNSLDSDISGVSLYHTGTDPNFNTSDQYDITKPFSSGSVTFTGSQGLAKDATTYFFVTYNIDIGATIGNFCDAKILINDITISASSYPTEDKDPPGNRTILADNKVSAWGSNGTGQLGIGVFGNNTDQHEPVQTHKLEKVVAVEAGWYYSLALRSDGTVWAWGNNSEGQLGIGTTAWAVTEPESVHIINVIAIAAEAYHSLALKSDGTVWAWGDNEYGQLGDGTTIDRYLPVQTSGLTSVVGIAAGDDYSLACKSDGTVWAWGRNNKGQLGINNLSTKVLPCSTHILPGVVAVSAGGGWHSLALKSDGTVWVWGYNNRGQLGIGSAGTNQLVPVQALITANVIAISAAYIHSLFLKSDNTIWACGMNWFGELGDGTQTQRNTPIQTHIIDDAIGIGAAQFHSLAIRSDSTVWTWGYNYSGQLGIGTFGSGTEELEPVQTHIIAGGIEKVAGGYAFSLAAGAPLPLAVEMLGFEAIPRVCSVELRWSLGSSMNIAQFVIERATEEKDYCRIVDIPGSGSSPMQGGYSYVDTEVEMGCTYFYKLGVVKTNGNTMWYGPVSATVIGKKPFLSISPNPFSAATTIHLSGIAHGAEAIELQIFDVSGRKVKEISLLPLNFSLAVTWDGRDDEGREVAPGVYFLRLRSGDHTASKKVLLVR